MKPQRIEQYHFEARPGLVDIATRHGLTALVVGGLSLAVLAVGWWYGPFGPEPWDTWGKRADAFYWMFTSVFGFMVASSVATGLYAAETRLRPGELRTVTRFGPWRWERRVACGKPLGIHVLPGGLSFIDDRGQDSGLALAFQRRRNLKRALKVLGEALPIEVDPPGRTPQAMNGRPPEPTREREAWYRETFRHRTKMVVFVTFVLFIGQGALMFVPRQSLPAALSWLSRTPFASEALLVAVVVPLALWAIRCPACGAWLGPGGCRSCRRRY